MQPSPRSVLRTPSIIKPAASVLDTPGSPRAPSSRPFTATSPAVGAEWLTMTADAKPLLGSMFQEEIWLHASGMISEALLRRWRQDYDVYLPQHIKRCWLVLMCRTCAFSC